MTQALHTGEKQLKKFFPSNLHTILQFIQSQSPLRTYTLYSIQTADFFTNLKISFLYFRKMSDSDEVFTCFICENTFGSKKALNEHRYRKRKVKLVGCAQKGKDKESDK